MQVAPSCNLPMASLTDETWRGTCYGRGMELRPHCRAYQHTWRESQLRMLQECAVHSKCLDLVGSSKQGVAGTKVSVGFLGVVPRELMFKRSRGASYSAVIASTGEPPASTSSRPTRFTNRLLLQTRCTRTAPWATACLLLALYVD